jgi:hypothetical protein
LSACPAASAIFLKQGCELIHHRATQLLGINDGHGSAIIAGNVMTNANGD